MKKTFFFLGLCCIFNSAFTQKKELEVTVADTMLIPADHFIMRVSASQNAFYDNPDTTEIKRPNYYVNSRGKMIDLQKTIINKLEIKMDSIGFHALPKSLKDFQNYGDYSNPSLNFRVNGKDSLVIFINKIIADKNLVLNIISVQTNNISNYEEQLLKKVIAKAKKHAVYLASLSNNKIASVISLSEHNNVYYNNSFNANVFQGISLTEKDAKKILTEYMIQNSITMKFSLE
ncbi:hypothetical protein GALL_46940 [mine drainage metagenome]|uniref:DUF541 domain-containing protein n=1 Tax=mine drainage metagenome TaxID=410659 RepID=A0A1J5TDG6_9ZZZZ